MDEEKQPDTKHPKRCRLTRAHLCELISRRIMAGIRKHRDFEMLARCLMDLRGWAPERPPRRDSARSKILKAKGPFPESPDIRGEIFDLVKKIEEEAKGAN